MKYKLLQIAVVENIIAFLDECQEEALMDGHNSETMQLVEFCNWAIKELLNAKEGVIKEVKTNKLNKQQKRYDKIDDKFFDWKLPPDMSEKDFDKMLNKFDGFLRGWEKEYNKKHPDKPSKRSDNTFKPELEDVVEYMSLEEIKEYLIDDESLTNEERMDLYYEEHLRVKRMKERKKLKKGAKSLDEIMKELNIKPSDWKDEEKN